MIWIDEKALWNNLYGIYSYVLGELNTMPIRTNSYDYFRNETNLLRRKSYAITHMI